LSDLVHTRTVLADDQ